MDCSLTTDPKEQRHNENSSHEKVPCSMSLTVNGIHLGDTSLCPLLWVAAMLGGTRTRTRVVLGTGGRVERRFNGTESFQR